MRQQLEQRLKGLKAEYAAGQKTLVDLKNRQDALRGTLLRISGAIKALKEELSKDSKEEK